MAKKSKSKTGDDEEGSSSFNPYTHLDDTLDSIEKDFSLSGSGLSRDERRMNTVSLAIDLVLGGGITAGGWYTFVGGEQSSKSTLANSTMAMAVNSSIPIVSMWDYEGSTDAEYLGNILKSNRIDANVEDVFGIRDPKTGKWLVKPRVRYYSETVAEKFFDYLAKLERLLPDVRKIGDDWFYIYENTKPNKSIVGSKYDKSYFSKTGKFRVPAPNGNLQALVICDSYPAMLPEKMDTDDPSNAMAMQARMFSEQMKRVKGRMKAKRIAVIGINQLRQKPAVMFGCFHGSSKVVMADGSTKAIRDLVLTRSREKVLSYNQKTGAVEARRIKDWFQNGTTDSWLQFKARGVSTGNGLSQFRCTPNHLLLGADGVMRPAAEYRVGDKLMANSYQPSLTADQKQVILGSIIGDGWFGKSGTFHIAHAESQLPYLEWKHSLLRNVCPSDICQGSGYVRKSGAEVKMYNFGTVQIKDRWFAEQFKEHRGEIEGFGYHLATMAKKIDLLGIAVWLMDDGSKRNWFTKMCSVSPLELRSFVNTLNRRFKLGLKVGYIGDDHGVNISAQTVQVLSRYLHPQFRDSLALAFPGVNLRNLGKYKPAKMATGSFGAPAEIWSIEQTANMTGKDTAGRSIHDRVKYDIEVEGNHTYCVNGIFVHNSPEYEPGGEALKFYSDCRIRLASRALSAVVNGGKGYEETEDSYNGEGEDTYRYVHARAIKNKLSVPNLECFLRIWITDADGAAMGIDPVFDTFQYLEMTGQISGPRKKMVLKLRKHDEVTLDWGQLKTLVLGSRKEVAKVCDKIGLEKMFIREFCRKQLNKGVGIDLFFENKKNAKLASKAKNKAAESDDDDDDDDED